MRWVIGTSACSTSRSTRPSAISRRPDTSAARSRAAIRSKTTRFATPCSSSTVRKTTPLAEPGRWRISTSPGSRILVPARGRVQLAGVAAAQRVQPRAAAAPAGARRRVRPVGQVVLDHRLALGLVRQGDGGLRHQRRLRRHGGRRRSRRRWRTAAGRLRPARHAAGVPAPPGGGWRRCRRRRPPPASASSARRPTPARQASLLDRGEGRAVAGPPGRQDRPRLRLRQPGHQPQPEPERQAAGAGRPRLQRAVPVAGVDVRPAAPPPHAPGRRGRSAPGRRSPSAGCSAARRRRPPGGGTSARPRHRPGARSWRRGSRESRSSPKPSICGKQRSAKSAVVAVAGPCRRRSCSRKRVDAAGQLEGRHARGAAGRPPRA